MGKSPVEPQFTAAEVLHTHLLSQKFRGKETQWKGFEELFMHSKV